VAIWAVDIPCRLWRSFRADHPMPLNTAFSVGCIHTRASYIGLCAADAYMWIEGNGDTTYTRMVRPGWRPLAVAHTHADWIGHCTPCSSASGQGNCVRCSYIYPIGYGLTQPRVHLGYRVVMFDTRKAIWTPLSWRDTVLKSVPISVSVTLRDRLTRDFEFRQK